MMCRLCNNDLRVLHDKTECLHCGMVTQSGKEVQNYGAVAGIKVIKTQEEYESYNGKFIRSRWDGDCITYEP